jgi:murein L,D-transpeptidase YafK
MNRTSSPASEKNKAAVNTTVTNNGIRSMERHYRSGGVPSGPTRIVIDKSDYELRVYDGKGILAVYPVVFGLDPQDDKYMQGDRKTPEGTFKIVYSKPHQLWKRMMMLDYPTKESITKFTVRKRNGLIPSSATIGSGIGIHGVETGSDRFIDHFYNWTNGCISLKNYHIDDLAKYIRQGTTVLIQK